MRNGGRHMCDDPVHAAKARGAPDREGVSVYRRARSEMEMKSFARRL